MISTPGHRASRRHLREALPAWGLNNLAGLLTETNRYAEAEPLYRRVLAIFEKRFGPDYPNVGIVPDNLASLMKDKNREPKAETT